MPHRIWRNWSWYTGRWWVGCYFRYSEEGTGRGCSPPRPLLAVPNVTAYPSTASEQITCYCCIMVHCSAVLMCQYRDNLRWECETSNVKAAVSRHSMTATTAEPYGYRRQLCLTLGRCVSWNRSASFGRDVVSTLFKLLSEWGEPTQLFLLLNPQLNA